MQGYRGIEPCDESALPVDAQDRELAAALEEYLTAIERGQPMELERLIASHPGVAERLREAAAGLQLVAGAATALREGVDGGGAASGSQQIGEFVVLRELGRGGMGIVYEAEQPSLGRKVALKVLPFAAVLDEKQVRRFKQEAQAVAQLHHSSIVPVHAVGCDRGVHYYAMQLIEGRNLAEAIRELREGGCREGVVGEWHLTIARLGIQAAEALAYAHNAGIVHRDIKPSNLMLDTSGRLWVTDFGLAKAHGGGSLTVSGNVLGTLRYMSPELAEGRNAAVDERTDIYGLGATLYELLTLRPPVDGDSREEILRRIALEEPAPPRRIERAVPRDLETIVLKALSKTPRDRYASAKDLARDLARFLEARPIAARRPGVLKKCAMWVRRHRALAGAAGTALALAILTVVLAVSREREARWNHYVQLVQEGIIGLELGILTSPGEALEGESLAEGLLYPADAGLEADRDIHQARRGLEETVEKLREAIRLWPGRPEAYLQCVRALQALGRRTEAERLRDAALERFPGFIPLRLRHIVDLRAAGQVENAEKLLAEVTRQELPVWSRLYLRAYGAAASRDWERVYGSYSELLDSFATAPEPWAGFATEMRLRRGRVALLREEPHRAVEDFAVVAALWPQELGPALLLASAWQAAGLDDEATRVLSDAVGRGGLAAHAVARVADFHRRHGKLDLALSTMEHIEDSGARAFHTAELYGGMEDFGKAAEQAQRALDLGVKTPAAYARLGWAFANTHQTDRAKATLHNGLAIFPENADLLQALGWNEFYSACNTRAIEIFEQALKRSPDDPHVHNGLGWVWFANDDPDLGMRYFNRAIELYPRIAFSFYGRGYIHWYRGELPLAVGDLVQCVVLMPTHLQALMRLDWIRSPETDVAFTPYWDDLRHAYSKALSRGVDFPLLRGFLALSYIYGQRRDLEKALEHALEAVKAGSRRDARFQAILAEVREARGESVEALQALELAVTLPRATKALPRRLAALRQRLPADLRTYASIEGLLQGPEENQSEEAVGLHVARLLSGRGATDQAMAHLEARLHQSTDATLDAWAFWLGLSSQSSPIDLQALLARLPPPPADLGGATPRAGLVEDVRWVLGSLDSHRPIRINCGGDEYTDHSGNVWGADRFFEGGERHSLYRPRIQGSRDPLLYQIRRRFWAHDMRPGYRIPLPSGQYRVTLHFTEPYTATLRGIFDIIIEDDTLLESYEPGALGLGVADQKQFLVDVEDGVLDIELRPQQRVSQISAIEILMDESH